MAETKTTKAAAKASESKAKTTASASNTTAAAKEIAALDAEKKPAAKKTTTAKKPAAKKAAAPKKAAAKKPAAKKAETVSIVQFAGNDYNVADVQAKAEADFKAENGRKAINEMSIYIKPEEYKAYYVVKSGKNEFNGQVDL